mmetsp:Transcript_39741/g.83159  ORF Transcript_39741/g.83159 Transcript_39741/m.83159 type:complete len:97 (-) Transcript_39741:5-295(-)
MATQGEDHGEGQGGSPDDIAPALRGEQDASPTVASFFGGSFMFLLALAVPLCVGCWGYRMYRKSQDPYAKYSSSSSWAGLEMAYGSGYSRVNTIGF